MTQPSSMDILLKKIMNIDVLRVGGASAGIFGSSGADYDILNSLKKSSIDFANEYRKPSSDQEKLEQLSNNIYGYLETLQLTHTLSEEKAHDLIDRLQELTDKR